MPIDALWQTGELSKGVWLLEGGVAIHHGKA